MTLFILLGVIFLSYNMTEKTFNNSPDDIQEQALLEEIFANVKDTNPIEFAEEVYTSPGFKKLSIETQETIKTFLGNPQFIKIREGAKKAFSDFVQSPQFKETRQKMVDYLSSEKVYEEGKKAGETIRNVLDSEEFQAVKKGMMDQIKGFMEGLKKE